MDMHVIGKIIIPRHFTKANKYQNLSRKEAWQIYAIWTEERIRPNPEYSGLVRFGSAGVG